MTFLPVAVDGIADAAAFSEAAVEAQRAIALLTAAIARPLEASTAADFLRTGSPLVLGDRKSQRATRYDLAIVAHATFGAFKETLMIPFKPKFALVAVCSLLGGCTSTGQLTPAASTAITTAYNNVCNALPALGPISATMNADAKNAYAQAQTICVAGAPTNAIAAGVDILAIENALLPYFKKA